MTLVDFHCVHIVYPPNPRIHLSTEANTYVQGDLMKRLGSTTIACF